MAERRRWTILVVGTLAQAATCSFLYGIPMLVPSLRASGLSLFQSSLIVSAPIAGLLLTLILWGAAADKYGERIVIVTGVGVSALFLAGAAATSGVVMLALLLALAGAFGASVNAASGRVVMGWFPVTERGLAMGTRQTAQPLGVAIAALVLPTLGRQHGPYLALLFPAVLCALASLATLLFVADPPRPARAPGTAPAGSPYRGSRNLARIHLSSTMLVVPQFAVASFTLVYLVGERNWGRRRGRAAGVRLPDRRRRRAHPVRGVVRPGGQPAASDAAVGDRLGVADGVIALGRGPNCGS